MPTLATTNGENSFDSVVYMKRTATESARTNSHNHASSNLIDPDIIKSLGTDSHEHEEEKFMATTRNQARQKSEYNAV